MIFFLLIVLVILYVSFKRQTTEDFYNYYDNYRYPSNTWYDKWYGPRYDYVDPFDFMNRNQYKQYPMEFYNHPFGRYYQYSMLH